MKKRPPQALICSFCGKSMDEVKRMVTGKAGHICDECVDTCVRVQSGVSIPEWTISTLETGECSICGQPPPRGVVSSPGKPVRSVRSVWEWPERYWRKMPLNTTDNTYDLHGRDLHILFIIQEI